MKNFILYTFFAFLPLCLLAQPKNGVNFNSREVSVWAQRAINGPYRNWSDFRVNTPNDWSRINRYAIQFRSNPIVWGNSSSGRDTNQTLWLGYDSIIDTKEQYPGWHGVRMQAAAFRYVVTGDISFGNPVKQVILLQVRYNNPLKNGEQISEWTIPPDRNTRPTSESGAKEALWLMRVAYSYQYTKNLFTASEQIEVENFLYGWANYFATRIHNGFNMYFTDRLNNNYTTRRFFFSETANQTQFPGISGQTQPRHRVWPNGRIYTHRNANGTLGNVITTASVMYDNRDFEKMQLITFVGVMRNDTTLIKHSKAFYREWLMFGVWPDGTYAEYERNGDYRDPKQGAMNYGAMNLQSYAVSADLLARAGDNYLYTFSTRDGVWGTQCTGTQPNKSFRLVLDRYCNNYTNTNPIYYNTIRDSNKIDDFSEGRLLFSSNKNVIWDAFLAIPNKFYRSSLYSGVYNRSATGTRPLVLRDIVSAGKISLPYAGSGVEFVGTRFQFANMESVFSYSQTPFVRFINSDTTVVGNPTSWVIRSESNVLIRRYEWSCVGPNGITLQGVNSPDLIINASQGGFLPKGVYLITLRVFSQTLNNTINSRLEIR